DAFGAMELMAGARNKMNRRVAQIEGEMSHRLDSIGMKDRAIELAQVANRLDVQDIADLVIGVHETHECFFRGGRQLLFEVLQVDMPVWKHPYKAQGGFAALVQVFNRMEGSMVFERGGNDMGAAQI